MDNTNHTTHQTLHSAEQPPPHSPLTRVFPCGVPIPVVITGMSVELKGYLGYVKEFQKFPNGDTFAKVEVSAHTMTSRQHTSLYDVKHLSVYCFDKLLPLVYVLSGKVPIECMQHPASIAASSDFKSSAPLQPATPIPAHRLPESYGGSYERQGPKHWLVEAPFKWLLQLRLGLRVSDDYPDASLKGRIGIFYGWSRLAELEADTFVKLGVNLGNEIQTHSVPLMHLRPVTPDYKQRAIIIKPGRIAAHYWKVYVVGEVVPGKGLRVRDHGTRAQRAYLTGMFQPDELATVYS